MKNDNRPGHWSGLELNHRPVALRLFNWALEDVAGVVTQPENDEQSGNNIRGRVLQLTGSVFRLCARALASKLAAQENGYGSRTTHEMDE